MAKSYRADQGLMEALDKRSQPIQCSEGKILFSQGEIPSGLYILRTGEAFLLASSSGEATECIRVTAGSLLGLKSVINNEPHSFTAVATSGADVAFVTREDFEALFRSQPLLYPRVLDILATQGPDSHLGEL
jgi:CRP-like cAMP-binding protein